MPKGEKSFHVLGLNFFLDLQLLSLECQSEQLFIQILCTAYGHEFEPSTAVGLVCIGPR